MINYIVLLLSLACPNVTVINHTSSWDEQDRQAFNRAYLHCVDEYSKSPCLVRFEKVEEGVYNALCGKPKSNVETLE